MSPGSPLPETGALDSSPTSRAVWSTLDAAANPASMLVMLAGLVRTLGAADYGVLAIALAMSGITMAVNPAIAVTTTKFVSELTNRQEIGRQSAAGVITAALITVIVIDLVLIGCTALWRESLSSWLFGGTAPNEQRGKILLLAMVAVGVQQIDAVSGAAMRGLEHFQRQAVIEMGMRTTLAAVVTGVAWRTSSVQYVLTAQCLVYFFFTLLRLSALRALLPGQRLLVRAGRHQVLALARYGGWMWLSAVAGVTYTSGDRIVVGRVLGAAAAGEYSVYVQLTQLVHFIPSSLFGFSLPAFSRLGSIGGARDEIRRAYRTYSLVICTIALGLSLVLMVLWPQVIRIIASNHLPGAAPISIVWTLTANFLLLSVTTISYYLLLGLGKSRLVSLVSSSWMCISVFLMIVLIPRYGLLGAGIARLIYALGTIQYIEKTHTLLR